MANEPELKSVFEHIEANAEEMAVYRARLGQRLPHTLSFRERFTLLARLLARPALVLAALLCMWLILPDAPDFGAYNLDELQAMVGDNGNRTQLREKAWHAWRDGDDEARRNAGVVLCLTLDTEQAMHQAVAGLTWESDPNYRAFYLELILDLADGYRFNIDRIDAMMDGEEDQVCLSLYREWIKLAAV